jgi:hypothetical protein
MQKKSAQRERIFDPNDFSFSTVGRAIDDKLKQIIENRKHEKITNERG